MEQHIQALLQVSAKLYEKLTTVPDESVRDEFIAEIDSLLDERGKVIQEISQSNFIYNDEDKKHRTLFELDKGIRNRLDLVMSSIKTDMKELQASKKSEQQYTNPYANVQVMDGMYYDKKK